MLARGDTEAATRECRELLEIRRERSGEGSREVAEAQADLLAALLAARRHAEAEEVGRQALDACRATYGATAEKTLNTLNSYCVALLTRGKAADAAPVLSEGHAAAVEAHGPRHPVTVALRDQLAVALLRTGEPSRAAELLSEALAERRESPRGDDRSLLLNVSRLAEALVAAGRPAEAERITRPYAAAVAQAEAAFESIELRRFRAAALQALARGGEAETLLREAYELAVARLGSLNAGTRRVALALAKLCTDAGRSADAAAWSSKAEGGKVEDGKTEGAAK
jgi:serine/threonine-protein kinase